MNQHTALNAMLQGALVAGRLLDRVIHDSPLGNPNFQGDRYAEYDRLLNKGPVIRSYVSGGWAVLGYQSGKEGLKDTDHFSAELHNSSVINRLYKLVSRGGTALFDNPKLLTDDPPHHTRLRKLARTGFLHGFVTSLEPRIRTLATECFDAIGDQREFDLIGGLARPLTANLIAEVLGVEADERNRFRSMSEAVMDNIGVLDVNALMRLNEAFEEATEFMNGVVERKRAQPASDVISNLVAVDLEGERLSSLEVAQLSGTLMSAGYETTMRLIGSAVYLLLRHPDQLADVRRDPSLLSQAVEETLRFEPPVQAVARVALQDMRFYDHAIKKGQTMIFIVAAANRDSTANERPYDFNIHRDDIKHLSFGYGIHLCLGAELARLESRIALEMLFERYPHIDLVTPQPHWEPSFLVRGLQDLWLRVA